MTRAPLPQLTIGGWLRYDAILRAVEAAKPRTICEIGAGEGAIAAHLALAHDYTALEPDEHSFAKLRQRLAHTGRGKAVCGTLELLGTEQFDLLCAFEVLEHIEDDRAALVAWRGRLKADSGHLLISVPAGSRSYGAWDRKVGHYRRYDRESLVTLLKSTGFDMVHLSATGAVFGHVLKFGHDVIARLGSTTDDFADATRGSGRQFQPKMGTDAYFRAAVAWPLRLFQRPFATTEFGTGYVVLARRS